MKHQFNLRPFREIIDSNLYGFAKMCTLHYCENADPNELYFSNIETNVKNLKKFIKYIKEDKRLYTFNDFFDCDFIYCFVLHIINNDESVKTNLNFLRTALQVCKSMILEASVIGEEDYLKNVFQLKNHISEIIQNITDEDGNLIEQQA